MRGIIAGVHAVANSPCTTAEATEMRMYRTPSLDLPFRLGVSRLVASFGVLAGFAKAVCGFGGAYWGIRALPHTSPRKDPLPRGPQLCLSVRLSFFSSQDFVDLCARAYFATSAAWLLTMILSDMVSLQSHFRRRSICMSRRPTHRPRFFEI